MLMVCHWRLSWRVRRRLQLTALCWALATLDSALLLPFQVCTREGSLPSSFRSWIYVRPLGHPCFLVRVDGGGCGIVAADRDHYSKCERLMVLRVTLSSI